MFGVVIWAIKTSKGIDGSEIQTAKTFRGIHKRILYLKDRALKQNIDDSKFGEASELGSDAIGTITLKEIDKWKSERKESIKKKMGRKKLNKEQVTEIVHKEILENPIVIPERNYTINDALTVGRVLDGKGIGIRQLMENDKQYLKFYNLIQDIKVKYADDQLNQIIN